MQLYHGLVSRMAEDDDPDYIFAADAPGDGAGRRKRTTRSPAPSCRRARTCSVGSGSGGRRASCPPSIDLATTAWSRSEFLESCHAARDLARQRRRTTWWGAFLKARANAGTVRASMRCLELGSDALLASARQRGRDPVVVLGRPTPSTTRCSTRTCPRDPARAGCHRDPRGLLPGRPEVPDLRGHVLGLWAAQPARSPPDAPLGQRLQHVVQQLLLRPDSFNLHFYAYAMEGKPFAIIETDGHSGDAGTKTRVEAFLHCVRRSYRQVAWTRCRRPGTRQSAEHHPRRAQPAPDPRASGAYCSSRAWARWRRGHGGLPQRRRGRRGDPADGRPGERSNLGRRHTSGKECVPMTITLGSLLSAPRSREGPRQGTFSFFMPTADGPCRFGVPTTCCTAPCSSGSATV